MSHVICSHNETQCVGVIVGLLNAQTRFIHLMRIIDDESDVFPVIELNLFI